MKRGAALCAGTACHVASRRSKSTVTFGRARRPLFHTRRDFYSVRKQKTKYQEEINLQKNTARFMLTRNTNKEWR